MFHVIKIRTKESSKVGLWKKWRGRGNGKMTGRNEREREKAAGSLLVLFSCAIAFRATTLCCKLDKKTCFPIDLHTNSIQLSTTFLSSYNGVD